MKPLIGITPNFDHVTKKYSVHQDYVSAIQIAGGLPILLFPDESLPASLDGILLTGGGDIDPLLFGEEPLKESGEIAPLRDAFEFALCQTALENNIPLFGICRGMQVMNIVAGGKIYQDIFVQTETHLKHNQEAPRSYGTHSIFIEPNTLLASLWQTKQTTVNSLHHQAVSDLGENFIVCAKSADGLAEAIVHTKNDFALGVQWHPEAMKTEQQQQLFHAFLQAAKRMQSNKEHAK